MTEQSKIEKQLDNSSTQSAAMDLTKSSSAPMHLNAIEEKHSALLAKYHEISRIGKGSQATMLKAQDADNHPVAIKVFSISDMEEWKDQELFEREIEVLKKIHIDGVPKYIETIRSAPYIYLIEEYIEAQSLEKQIANGRKFTIDESITIFERTAEILRALGNYTPPVIHRDIKPSNLLVDDHLHVWLVDFGVVADNSKTFSMTFAGTAGYVAPEQLYGKVSAASDIFSLGATMLHLITGISPCDMRLKGIQPDFDHYLTASVPEWLKMLIVRMMATNPEERPQTGTELLALIHNRSNYTNKIANPSSKYIVITLIAIFFLAAGVVCAFLNSVAASCALLFVAVAVAVAGIIIKIKIQRGSSIETTNRNHTSIEPEHKPTSEFLELLKKAENDDPFAQNELGDMYYNGTGVEKDYHKAVEWYQKSAIKRIAKAQCNLGYMYYNGFGVEKDYQKAVEWYQKSANQGCAAAQCNLGVMYRNGFGVEKDYHKAIELYQKAINQGNATAQYNLGFMYENGFGVEKDYNLAVEWYQKSANQGYANAQFNLGTMYQNGYGVEKDYHIAVEWYKKAAEQGDEDAKKALHRLGK